MKLNIPPSSKNDILTNEALVEILKPLVGTEFTMTFKPRTDGSRIRRLISTQIENHATNASSDAYTIPIPRKKGLPRILSELIDTYVVSTGESYNLQVWNRNPNGKNILVKYANGEIITPKDIRFVMVKISPSENRISSITILTPLYIEKKFGKFGKPTIKNQLMINGNARNEIITSKSPLLFCDDTKKIKQQTSPAANLKDVSFTEAPSSKTLLPLSIIREKVAKELIGKELSSFDTKSRGQELERIVIEMLGYEQKENLMGGFPDVPNQLLEVKVQEAQTVDLGKYSPQFIEPIPINPDFSTEDVRYLIALTNPHSHVIEGIILSSGENLGRHFTYVNATSFKCQRSIPMSFFDNLDGTCTFNP